MRPGKSPQVHVDITKSIYTYTSVYPLPAVRLQLPFRSFHPTNQIHTTNPARAVFLLFTNTTNNHHHHNSTIPPPKWYIPPQCPSLVLSPSNTSPLPRQQQTTKKPSPSSTSVATAAFLSPHSATFSAPADRTPQMQKSKTLSTDLLPKATVRAPPAPLFFVAPLALTDTYPACLSGLRVVP